MDLSELAYVGCIMKMELAASNMWIQPAKFGTNHGNPCQQCILFEYQAGWWFGTCFFHSVGNFIIPTDEVHHFSEG
jgi:hypothetical protein